MNIVHVLRDGSIVKDISGHIVRYEDAQQMYKAIKRRRPQIIGGKNEQGRSV